MLYANQKLENLLNLSLEISPGERALSQELETGYMPGERAWELIVKYSGSLDAVREMGVRVEEMRNEYAILIVPENLIDQVSALPQIEYVEKPKRLFFSVNQGRAASCITSVQGPGYDLYGQGILVAVLDSGVDYTPPGFPQRGREQPDFGALGSDHFRKSAGGLPDGDGVYEGTD